MEKVQNNVKTSWNYNLVVSLPPEKKTVKTSQRLLENRD